LLNNNNVNAKFVCGTLHNLLLTIILRTHDALVSFIHKSNLIHIQFGHHDFLVRESLLFCCRPAFAQCFDISIRIKRNGVNSIPLFLKLKASVNSIVFSDQDFLVRHLEKAVSIVATGCKFWKLSSAGRKDFLP